MRRGENDADILLSGICTGRAGEGSSTFNDEHLMYVGKRISVLGPYVGGEW